MTTTRYAKLLIFIQYIVHVYLRMYSGTSKETMKLNDLAVSHSQSSSVSYCLTLCAVEALHNTTNLTTALFALIFAFVLFNICMYASV